MNDQNLQFYAALPVNNLSLADLLLRNELFTVVPDDWYVIVTDIKNLPQLCKQDCMKT